MGEVVDVPDLVRAVEDEPDERVPQVRDRPLRTREHVVRRESGRRVGDVERNGVTLLDE
jgi:hypothetical protein